MCHQIHVFKPISFLHGYHNGFYILTALVINFDKILPFRGGHLIVIQVNQNDGIAGFWRNSSVPGHPPVAGHIRPHNSISHALFAGVICHLAFSPVARTITMKKDGWRSRLSVLAGQSFSLVRPQPQPAASNQQEDEQAAENPPCYFLLVHNFSLLIKKLIHLGISFSNHFLLVTNLNISLDGLPVSHILVSSIDFI